MHTCFSLRLIRRVSARFRASGFMKILLAWLRSICFRTRLGNTSPRAQCIAERLRPMHKPKKTAICKQACMAVFSALCALGGSHHPIRRVSARFRASRSISLKGSALCINRKRQPSASRLAWLSSPLYAHWGVPIIRSDVFQLDSALRAPSL